MLFILQDHVLTGLHRTGWVPVSNALASVAKIALLPVLAFSAGWAIFAASVLPAAAVVVLVTVVVLRRRPTEAATGRPVSMSRLIRFAATDHVAALLWLATANVLTLMVLQQLGPEASAYYFMANTIAYALFLVTSNISSALVAEGARSPDRAPALVRAALRNASLLVLPAAALGVLLAGPVLGLFGPDYVANARVLLQLLLLSAVPQLVIGVALAAARLRQDLRTVVLTYAGLAVITYGGSWLGLAVWGLTGVGIACLASQTVIAVLLLVTGRSGLGGPGVRRELGRRLGPALAACGLPGSTPRAAAHLRLRRPGRRRGPAERADGAEDRHLGGRDRRSGPARRRPRGRGSRADRRAARRAAAPGDRPARRWTASGCWSRPGSRAGCRRTRP